VVFVADDLVAWVIGLLADAGRKKLTTLVLGSDQKRALRSAVTAAVLATAEELRSDDDEQAARLALVVSQVFSQPVPDLPLAEHRTVLGALQAGISRQFAFLDGARLAGQGQSSADLLGVPSTVLTEKLTGHLVREIMARGSRGGPLFPLASQLNDDETHLQGSRIEEKVDQVDSKVREALARLDDTHAVTVASAALAQLPPVAPVAASPGLSNVPVRPVMFVGRKGALARLTRGLSGGGAMVVHGLGGAGKSTLAAQYAAASEANPVWWIPAENAARIDLSLAALATALGVLSAGLTLEELRDWAVRWLQSHDSWLLVLDNVDDPQDVAWLVARAPRGQILITSRRSTGWHQIGVPIPLNVLTKAEAVKLLSGIVTANGPRTLDGVADLCAELGFLPLAIEQAGAYILAGPDSPRRYLELLARFPAALFAATGNDDGEHPTIARVWNVTISRLAAIDPLAVQTMQVLAWFAPEKIPVALVEGANEPVAVGQAVRLLASYSMLKAADGTVSVHRLVQAVSRTPDPADPRSRSAIIEAARDVAITRMLAILPDGDPQKATAGWPRWRELLAHIEALAGHIPPDTDTPDMAHVINSTGLFLYGQGSPKRTVTYFKRAAEDFERMLGKDHPDTLTARSYLARAYNAAGDRDRAIPLLEQTLADRERVLGDDHPDTLTSRNSLAYAYGSGSVRERWRGIVLFDQTLAGRQRVLGDDHPDTLTTRSNLASALRDIGSVRRAIELHEQTLADRQRVLGDDHPDTIASRNNLACTLAAAGDLQRAIPMHERALAETERVLGADHPDTLVSRNNLAAAYGRAGRVEEAIQLHEQVLASFERVLGADHTDTLQARRNLGVAYAKGERLPVRAINFLDQTLEDAERVLGEDHPLTRAIEDDLSKMWQKLTYRLQQADR
jgi:tetratricopeptide (TPR) repeat protein